MSDLNKIIHLLEKNKNNDALLQINKQISGSVKSFAVLKLAGIAYARLEKWEEAEKFFLAAMDQRNNDQDLYFQLSKVFKLSGQIDKNIKLLDEYLEKYPSDFRVLNEIGSLFFSKGWSDLSIKCFSRAVQINNRYKEAYHNLCAVYFSIGKYQEAASVVRSAIPLCNKVDAFALRSDLLVYLVRGNLLDEGQEVANHLILDFDKKYQKQHPQIYGNILNNLGILFMALNDSDAAENSFLKSIENNPKYVDPYTNIARLFAYKEDFNKAIYWFDRALSVNPDNVNLHEFLAQFLRSAGRPELALSHHYAILAQTPESAQSLFSLSQTQFMLGDLQNAYLNYEWRWASPEGGVKPETNLPEWSGSPSSGRAIFVYREQGIGDELIFAGAFSDLLNRFERVYCTCHPKLQILFERSFPAIQFVESFNSIKSNENIEFSIAIGSLATIFRPTIDSFQGVNPYLAPNISLCNEYRNRLLRSKSQLVVGVAWRSALKAINRQSIYPLIENWEPIFKIQGIVWINFQYGDQSEDVDYIRNNYNVDILDFEDIDHFNELDKSVALMKACDVMVGPATAVTMLSGAAGVPTLRIAIYEDEFMLGTDHYPWLSALVPVGRRFGEPWSVPIEKVAAILRGLVSPSV